MVISLIVIARGKDGWEVSGTHSVIQRRKDAKSAISIDASEAKNSVSMHVSTWKRIAMDSSGVRSCVKIVLKRFRSYPALACCPPNLAKRFDVRDA